MPHRPQSSLPSALPRIAALATALWIAPALLVAQQPPEKDTQGPNKPAAKGPSQAELVAQRDAYRHRPVFAQNGWTFDYDQALAQAKERQVPVFAYFAVSALPNSPGSQLEQTELASPAFAAFGKQVVLFCHITSYVQGEPHDGLLREKGGQGFPYLAFLDADGNVLLSPRERTAASCAEALATIARMRELTAKAKTGDQDAIADLMLLHYDLGKLKFADAQERRRLVTSIDAAKQKRLDALVFELEVEDIINSGTTQATFQNAGDKLLALLDQDRVPSGRIMLTFYSRCLFAAAQKRDAAAYEKSLAGFRRATAGEARYQKTIEVYEQQLKTLKAQAAIR